MPGPGPRTTMTGSVDRPDQILDLLGMGTELLCELVEIGIGNRCEALLVYVLDDLDAKTLQLGGRRLLQFERPGRLFAADFRCRRRNPFLLFGREALPQPV